MGNQTLDTKLARRLQKRGKWPSYTACLREVQKWLAQGDWSGAELRERIDAGDLDPEKCEACKAGDCPEACPGCSHPDCAKNDGGRGQRDD